MSAESKASASGMGFGGWLTLAFIILKLTHYIDWSWWWVLSPIWIIVGLFLAIVAIVGLVTLIASAFQ